MDDGRRSYSSGFENNRTSLEDGLIEVKDGIIVVTNPTENGQMARIKAGKGLKVLINGMEIFTATAVSNESDIKVILPNKNAERKFDINIGDNAMSVSSLACYMEGEEYLLKSSGPAHELEIEAEVAKRIECPCYTPAEAKELLKMKGIVYGILEDRLKDAVSKGNIDSCTVAQGIKTLNGIDDKIDFKFDDVKKYSIVNDRVDFYSIGRVSSVEPGDLLAEKIPGNDGQPGIDVFGKKIAAAPGKKLSLVAGKGAELSSDGIKLYSKVRGRPEVKGNIVSVYEVYEVPKDVDISTGNIEFTGDVVIKGDVTDGMKVKAGNTILILGSSTNNFIVGGSDVKVNKNVIGTDIKAGCADFIKYNIIDSLKNVEKGLMSIYTAAEALKDTGKVPKTYKDGQIIKLLMDTKYKDIEKCVSELRSTLFDNREYIGSDMLAIGARLIKYFLGNGPLLIEGHGELMDFRDMLVEQIEVLKSQLKKPSHISVNYIQNSKLSTSGNIIITGKGCYNSELSCRGSVIFEKPGSVMRGGSINAGQDVKVYELGSLSGAHTLVSTSKDATIYCETAHANSVIRIGEMSNRLETSVKKFKAYQFKSELMVECLKI